MGILHTIDTILTVVEDHKEVGFVLYFVIIVTLTEIFMINGHNFEVKTFKLLFSYVARFYK